MASGSNRGKRLCCSHRSISLYSFQRQHDHPYSSSSVYSRFCAYFNNRTWKQTGTCFSLKISAVKLNLPNMMYIWLQVWSVPSQRFQFTFSGHSNWVRSCCFSPDGRLAVSGSDDKTVRVWDVATRQCIRVYDDHSGYVNSVAFHPDGTCIASAGTDNAIKVSCQGGHTHHNTAATLNVNAIKSAGLAQTQQCKPGGDMSPNPSSTCQHDDTW